MTQLRIDQIPAHIISVILSKQGLEEIATCYRTCKYFQKTIEQHEGLIKKLYIYYFGQKMLENVLATKKEKSQIHDELLKEFQLFGKLSKGDVQIRRLDIKLNFKDYRTTQREINQTSWPQKGFFESINVQQVCFQGYRIGALIRVRQRYQEFIYLAIFDTLVGHLIAEPMKIKEDVYKQSLNRPDSMSLAFKQNMAIVRYNRDAFETGRNKSDAHGVGQLLLLQTFIIEQIGTAKGDGQEHATAQQQHDNSSKARSAQMIDQQCCIQGIQTFQLQMRLQQNIRIVDLTNSLQEYITQSVIEGMPSECRQAIRQRLNSLPYQHIEFQDSVLSDSIFGTPKDHNIFLLMSFDGYTNGCFMGAFMVRINLRTGLIEMIYTPMSNLQVHCQLLEYIEDMCGNAKYLLGCLYKDSVMQLSKNEAVILYCRFVTRQYSFQSKDGVKVSEVLEYVDLFNIRQSYTISMNEIKGVIRDKGNIYMESQEFGLGSSNIEDMAAEICDYEVKKLQVICVDLKHCFDGISEHENAQGKAFDTNQHIIFQGDRLLAQETKALALNLNHAVIFPQCKDSPYKRFQYEEQVIYPKVLESKPPTTIMLQQVPLSFIDYKRITKSYTFLVDENIYYKNHLKFCKIYFGGSHFLYRTLHPYIVKTQLCYEIVQAGQSNGEFSYIMSVDNNPISNDNTNYNCESSISSQESIGGKCQHSIEENKDQNVFMDTIVLSDSSIEQDYPSSGTLFNTQSKKIESNDVCKISNYQNANCVNDNINNQQDDKYVSGCHRHSIDTSDNYPIQYVYGDTRYEWTDGLEENALHPKCESKGGGIDTYLSSFKLNPLQPYIDDHAKQRHMSYNGQLKVFSEYIEPNLLQIHVSSCNRAQAQNLRDIHHAQETFQLEYENKPKGIQKECILHNTLSFQPYGFVLTSYAYYNRIQKCNYDIFVIN